MMMDRPLKTLLDRCVDELGVAIERFPWEERHAYSDWLAQTYYYVRHTTRLQATAAARFPMDERGNALHHRFAQHMGEEKKHELLAIHDMKQLEASIADFPEHASTRMFYEPQYYKFEHLGPTVSFGYILPLEALGPGWGKHIIERVVAVHGAKCTSFLRLHSDEDPEHLRTALEVVETLTGAERALIDDNMRQTTFGYCTMLSEIQRRREQGNVA
jgi:hypothetical protein